MALIDGIWREAPLALQVSGLSTTANIGYSGTLRASVPHLLGVSVTANLRYVATIWQGAYASTNPPPCAVVYKMRGMDAAVDALYDSWLSPGAPDLTASLYTGTLAKPLRDVVATDRWEK